MNKYDGTNGNGYQPIPAFTSGEGEWVEPRPPSSDGLSHSAENKLLKLQNKNLKSELSFYDRKCSECHFALGLLAESECPICAARSETEKYSQLWLDLVDKNTANAALAEERGRRLAWAKNNPRQFYEICQETLMSSIDEDVLIDAAMEDR